MRLSILLSRDEFDRLEQIARAEHRHPRDQATHLLAQALGLSDPPAHPSLVRPMPPGDRAEGKRELAEAAR